MSFRARLTLAYLALLTLSLSAFGLGVYAFVEHRLRDSFHQSLRTEARRFAEYAAVFQEEALETGLSQSVPTPNTFIEVFAKKSRRDAYLSRYRNDLLRDGSLPEVPVERIVVADTPRGRLALYSQPFDGASTPVTIQQLRLERQSPPKEPSYLGKVTVARSLDDLEQPLGFLRNILVGGGLTVLTLAVLIGLGLAAALLRPLGRMRSTAQRIGDERDFSRRMPVDNERDELGRLSVAFNEMLTELEQSHAHLRSTLDAQRRFVADASHELRTPMTVIRTNLEFLSRVPDARDEDRKAALDDVLTEMGRMETLVGDLLALARLEGAARPARRPVRLDQVLADTYRDALRTAPAEVEVVLGPTTEASISGDRDDLRRALWNLVENALKYTPAGRVELSLRVADGLAEVEVADSGIGIAEPHQQHVFDRFWRAPGVRGTPGSGLGLAITRWVVQAHGGTIAVDSRLGEGTRFTIRLPVVGSRPPRRPEQAPTKLVGSPHS